MKELGYSRQEQAQIQKELLCVAHAPFAPLGVSKSTMISFVSAQDWEIRHYNNFEKEIRPLSKNNKVLLSYFPDKKGEMFLAPSLGEHLAYPGPPARSGSPGPGHRCPASATAGRSDPADG